MSVKLKNNVFFLIQTIYLPNYIDKSMIYVYNNFLVFKQVNVTCHKQNLF